jgi:predicted PurR-regulated permease PerM
MTGTNKPKRPPASRRDPRPHQVGWRTRDILRAAVLVAGVFVALRLLWAGRSVFLLGFLGVLFGLALSAGVDYLHRFKVPRVLGAVLIVLTALGALVGVGALTAPRISEQAQEVRRQVPQVIDQVERWIEQRGMGRLINGGAATDSAHADGSAQGQEPQGDSGEEQQVDIRRTLSQQLAGVGQHFFSFFSSTLAVLGGAILVMFVSIFVAVDPKMYHDGLMHLFPHRSRERAGEVLSAVAVTLRRWLVAQLIAMVVIGVVTALTLTALGIQGAVALGIIAGLLEFVPYVGPILSAVPAVAMGLLDGPEKALYVVLAYTAIQQLESGILQPILMKEGLDIPPVLTILGQALLSLTFGFMGLLVAVPILGAVMVPVKMLYVRDVVGDEVSVPHASSGEEDVDEDDG